MKKPILLAIALTFSIGNALALARDSDYAKTVMGGENVRHSLMTEGKPLVHLFDAVPKLRVYRYTGTKAHVFMGGPEVGNYNTDPKRIPYGASGYKLAHTLLAANDGELNISIEDWAFAPKVGQDAWVKGYRQMYDVLGKFSAMPVPPSDYCARVLPGSRWGDAGFEFKKGDNSRFISLYKDRYLITVTLSRIEEISDCASLEKFVMPYLEQIYMPALDLRPAPAR